MQDTPSFDTYRNQFNQISLTNLLDLRETVREPYRSFIEETYGKLNDYFTDEEFRRTLSVARKNNIEGQINNIIAQLNNLQNWQNDGTSIAANIESIYMNISAYIDDLDTRFTVPRDLHKIQIAGNIDAIAQEVKTKSEGITVQAEDNLETIKTSVRSASKVLDDARKMVGSFASYKLADYYQNLANGRTVEEQERTISKSKRILPLKWVYRLVVPAMFVLYITLDWLLKTVRSSNISSEQLVLLGVSVGTPALVLALLLIYNAVNRTHPGGYARASLLWMIGAICATLATAGYAALLVIQMGANPGWEEIVPKIIGLLAPAYLIRFCVQNYKANKHLEIHNTHRATVSKIVSPFVNLISHENPDLENEIVKSRNNVIEAAGLVLFSQSETGFLTTKEGAGSSDDMLDGFRKVN